MSVHRAVAPGAERDAVVVGAGPNGLAAAIALADAGLSTLLLEAASEPGGGMRSAELTLPGFVHDVCSSVHPLGLASPYFRDLGLERHGLAWAHSRAELVHVIDEKRAVVLHRSLAETARGLGGDGEAYRRLFEPFVARFDELMRMVLGPLRLPHAPLLLARFGLAALRSMEGLAQSRFRRDEAPALLAGIAAHAMLPLDTLGTASFALVLAGAGHAVGWPVARGGSRAIATALVRRFREAGGELALDRCVERLADLPGARARVFDAGPKQLLAIAGEALPSSYRRRLARFRYGPGVFKMDWALREPIPWRLPECALASTVHLAGTAEEVAAAEAAVHAGFLPAEPFVLVVQPTLADPERAPPGRHIAWAYCHVPHGSAVDASSAIEERIESFAPGFREVVLGRATRNAVELERYDPNFVGGDISGGASDLRQLFTRPVARLDPYATPVRDLFLCSSSTPPGGGVHGMCGYWAARSVARNVFGRATAAEGAAERFAAEGRGRGNGVTSALP